MERAISGKKVVFFVDAAHFVHRAYLGFLWCFTRTFICSPSCRKRFNVLGAVNAVTKEIITIINETYIHSESLCQLLFNLANMGLNKPILIVLDNASYHKCKLVHKYTASVGIKLCYLPCYSPQLNLIEIFCKFIRNECLYSK
ncbi:Mobile element protein [Richelia intracellularis]|nr:Mobile element protein [Richelia intracellularis]